MTQKELLYIEDAISHEENIILLCEDFLEYLEDKKLISFFEKEIKYHNEVKKELLCMLEVKSNE